MVNLSWTKQKIHHLLIIHQIKWPIKLSYININEQYLATERDNYVDPPNIVNTYYVTHIYM